MTPDSGFDIPEEAPSPILSMEFEFLPVTAKSIASEKALIDKIKAMNPHLVITELEWPQPKVIHGRN